jgi:ubiquinone/menaquinone biosynthesis C-methylase UbiE
MQPTVYELGLGRQGLKGRTRRMYDLLSGVYPVSSYLFHSRAHKAALEMSGIRDGMRVLEVATGSGEMFGRLTEKNRHGETMGIDLSPKMAARTQRLARKHYPAARAHCQAVDARRLPFRDGSFDAVFCCYLFELLGTDDIQATLAEIRRVLRPHGIFTTTLIGQNTEVFNQAYRAASQVIPSFWGRQVEARMPAMIKSFDFRIVDDRSHRQTFYPSRILCCRKE